MGRYDLRLRSIYGADELTGGERLQRGIGAAIEEKQKEQGEDSARRAQGQVLTKETGVMDRLRSVGRRVQQAGRGIAGMIHGDEADALPSMSPQPPMNPADVNDQIAHGVNPIARRGELSSAPGLTPTFTPGVEARPTVSASPRPSIASAIQPYEDQDSHGNTWSVDPLYKAKVEEAGQQLGTDRRLREIEARNHGLDVEERERLVRAQGEEARRTQTQKDAAAAQRTADLIAGRREVAELARRFGANSREVQAKVLELRERGLDLQEERLRQSAEGAYVKTEQGAQRIEYGRGKAPDPISATMETPEAKAAREKANRAGAAHSKNVDQVQARRAGANAPQGTPTFESARAEEARLVKTGLTKAQARASMKAKGWPIK